MWLYLERIRSKSTMLKSTHPTGDATQLHRCNNGAIEAKIHASHRGCDFLYLFFLLLDHQLKSTHPTGDATAKYSVCSCKKAIVRTNILYFFSSNQIGWIENGRYFIFSGANRPGKFWALEVRTFHSWSSPLRCIYCTWQLLWCQMDRFSNNNPLRIVSVCLQNQWTISWRADIICLSVFVL